VRARCRTLGCPLQYPLAHHGQAAPAVELPRGGRVHREQAPLRVAKEQAAGVAPPASQSPPPASTGRRTSGADRPVALHVIPLALLTFVYAADDTRLTILGLRPLLQTSGRPAETRMACIMVVARKTRPKSLSSSLTLSPLNTFVYLK